MRTITAAQWRTLEDLSAEGLLQGLPPQTAEKDIHITDVLGALSTLEVRHRFLQGRSRDGIAVDDGIHVVFAGGTCLSKAYGLTSRMSEDVDIKVFLKPPTRGLKRDVGDRARMKALHQHLLAMLGQLGLHIPAELNDAKNPRYRDNHRYAVIGATYESKGPALTSLRPEIKLEVIHREPRLDTAPIEFGYLFERLAGQPPSSMVRIACISVGETLAEKVLSLLRRCAMSWAGVDDEEADPALVRHVYDVFQIIRAQPAALTPACQVFPSVVQQDANEYRRQHPAFDEDPHGVLRAALTRAKGDAELVRGYEQKVLPLIYGAEQVSYATAFELFEGAAQTLLQTLRPSTT